MNLVLTIVGFAAFFSFLALSHEVHQIVEELQLMRRLLMDLVHPKAKQPDEFPF